MSTKPYGMTIFCDDIRQEVSGKITLVGCYRSDMVIHGGDFPIMLPKLGLAVTYYEPRNLPWKPIDICVFFPGDEDDSPSIRAEVKQPPSESAKEGTDGQEHNLRGIRMETILGPVTIAKPGRIRVRAYRDGQETRLGTLIVRKGDTPQTT